MKSASFLPLQADNNSSVGRGCRRAATREDARPTKAISNRKSKIVNFHIMHKASKKTMPATKSTTPTQQRLWLMYPPKLIKKPFIWEVGHKFKVVTNIRQASVTDEIGIVCLELDGKRDEVKAAIKWLEKQGVNVEPVEIGVIAG
jgi:ABC-type methionine transport system ATPase subunit